MYCIYYATKRKLCTVYIMWLKRKLCTMYCVTKSKLCTIYYVTKSKLCTIYYVTKSKLCTIYYVTKSKLCTIYCVTKSKLCTIYYVTKSKLCTVFIMWRCLRFKCVVSLASVFNWALSKVRVCLSATMNYGTGEQTSMKLSTSNMPLKDIRSCF
jgi:hypothetical protein